ncbi:MFS transporter [Arthrobacter sp. NPDC056691]|uniref:MFS transporter n=1 Tax=Arthrobacter sp. NPDC056691 TaxID=3345913 RepID=UPI00366C960B
MPDSAVIVLCLVQFVDVLGVTSAITAIPAMLEGVGAGHSLAGPLATAYAMFFGGLLVLGARLGRKYGHRRILFGGLAGFVLASALGSVAAEGWHLVAARAMQGAASAVSVPAALSLLLSVANDKGIRAPALALWSAAGAAAGAAGFFIGGGLTDLLGWPAVFWMNIPIGILLSAGVRWRVAAPGDREPHVSFDIPGAMVLIGSVMAVVVGAAFLENAASRALGAAAVALGILGAFVLARWMKRAPDPIIPPSALRRPKPSLGTFGSFINTATTSSTSVLLTLFLQQQEALTPFQTGLALLPVSLAVIAGSSAAAPVIKRSSRRMAITAGLALIAAGNLLAAFSLASIAGIVMAVSLIGFGLGLSSVGCNDLGTDLPGTHVSTTTGLLNTGAQVGTALGAAVLVLVASAGTYGAFSAYSVGLLLAAATALATAVVMARTVP